MLHPEMKITTQALIGLAHCQNTLEGTWPSIYIRTQTQRDNDLTAKHRIECNLTTAAMRNLMSALHIKELCYQKLDNIKAGMRHDAFPISSKCQFSARLPFCTENERKQMTVFERSGRTQSNTLSMLWKM